MLSSRPVAVLSLLTSSLLSRELNGRSIPISQCNVDIKKESATSKENKVANNKKGRNGRSSKAANTGSKGGQSSGYGQGAIGRSSSRAAERVASMEKEIADLKASNAECKVRNWRLAGEANGGYCSLAS